MDCILIHRQFEQILLTERNHIRQEVIIAKSGGEVIEDPQEHHRHQIHDPLHLWILRRHLHVHVRVHDGRNRHQNGKQTHVIAIKRNGEWQIQYGVIGR